MKITSINQQLLLNIVFPVILGLLIIGVFSYNNTKTILSINNETEQNFIYDEIRSFIELQFVALSIVEEPMEQRMRDYSSEMIHDYFKNTTSIENIDLRYAFCSIVLPSCIKLKKFKT